MAYLNLIPTENVLSRTASPDWKGQRSFRLVSIFLAHIQVHTEYYTPGQTVNSSDNNRTVHTDRESLSLFGEHQLPMRTRIYVSRVSSPCHARGVHKPPMNMLGDESTLLTRQAMPPPDPGQFPASSFALRPADGSLGDPFLHTYCTPY